MGNIELKPIAGTKEYAVYTEKVFEKDSKTGEITKDASIEVIKTKKRDNFIKVFVDNIDFLGANLSNAERQVLVGLLAKVDYQNIIYLHSEFRKELAKKYNISQATISIGIKGLMNKKILLDPSPSLREKMEIYATNAFLINPDVAGRGSFNELQKLRQEIFIDYDFNTLEIKKTFSTKAKYVGYDDVFNNLDGHEIKQISQEVSPDGITQNTEIVVQEKGSVIDVEPSGAKQYDDNQNIKDLIELERLKNENLKLELEIKRVKL